MKEMGRTIHAHCMTLRKGRWVTYRKPMTVHLFSLDKSRTACRLWLNEPKRNGFRCFLDVDAPVDCKHCLRAMAGNDS